MAGQQSVAAVVVWAPSLKVLDSIPGSAVLSSNYYLLSNRLLSSCLLPCSSPRLSPLPPPSSPPLSPLLSLLHLPPHLPSRAQPLWRFTTAPPDGRLLVYRSEDIRNISRLARPNVCGYVHPDPGHLLPDDMGATLGAKQKEGTDGF